MDRPVKVVPVDARNIQGIVFRQQMDRIFRDRELPQKVVSERKLCRGLRFSVLIRCQNLHQRVFRDHGEVLSRIQPEHRAFQGVRLEFHDFGIEKVRHLFQENARFDPFVFNGKLLGHDRRVLIQIGECDRMHGRIQAVSSCRFRFPDRIRSERQKPCFGDSAFIRFDRSDQISLCVSDFKNASGNPTDLIHRGMDLSVSCFAHPGPRQDFPFLFDPDHALCRSVFQFQHRRFLRRDGHRIHQAVQHIREDGREFFDIPGSGLHLFDQNGSVLFRDRLERQMIAVRVGIDPEVHSFDRTAALPGLPDQQRSECRRVDSDARS